MSHFENQEMLSRVLPDKLENIILNLIDRYADNQVLDECCDR